MCLLQVFLVETLVPLILRHFVANESLGDCVAVWHHMHCCTHFRTTEPNHICVPQRRHLCLSGKLGSSGFFPVSMSFLSCAARGLKYVLIFSPLNITSPDMEFAKNLSFLFFASVLLLYFYIFFPVSFFFSSLLFPSTSLFSFQLY